AAGQQCDRRSVGPDAERPPNTFARPESPRQINERMTDKLHGHAAVTVDLLLEGKDDEHAIGDLANRLQPAGTPRPDLRADVIHDRDAEAPHLAREREVEVWKVDDDERVRTVAAGRREQPAERRPRARNFHDRL